MKHENIDLNSIRQQLNREYHADETKNVLNLLKKINNENLEQTQSIAQDLVTSIRAKKTSYGGIDAFLQQFKLSTTEGIALMCLAEALLRVPDKHTIDALIQDKLSAGKWQTYVGQSESLLVNASTWGLMFTGKLTSFNKDIVNNPSEYVTKLIAKIGEPTIRVVLRQAMKIMGGQFVLAPDIKQAIKTTKKAKPRYSYDMLGEAARTETDAQRYFESYKEAIQTIGENATTKSPFKNQGISVKLSALHPRYEYIKIERVKVELFPRILALATLAKDYNLGLTIDAEEADRLDPSLTLLEMLCETESLKKWDGLGFVVQAYQKRALTVIDWLLELSKKHSRQLMVRLVKGAYWDTEIKQAQLNGYNGYPVYTRKASTDISYLCCAQKLLSNKKYFYPLFATHNAHTVARILTLCQDTNSFEFQCLHGMGKPLYDVVQSKFEINLRIYAPVGPHKELLAYLVRRLLENGANTSFVNHLTDPKYPIETLIADPINQLSQLNSFPHSQIPLPVDMYLDRKNSKGLNINNPNEVKTFLQEIKSFENHHWGPKQKPKLIEKSINPTTLKTIGCVEQATLKQVTSSIEKAKIAQSKWNQSKGESRAVILNTVADLLEKNSAKFIYLCIAEAGKTLPDAIAELREAVDFLRYYANNASLQFTKPTILPGPTGEKNELMLHGRGVFVCISPWNFPLAIFIGQISAALAAGNSVIAKPAEQTPLIAYEATKLFYEAGLPENLLALMCGDGETVGQWLISDPRIDGIAFTGSNAVAKIIQKTIAKTQERIIPLIAETGGINAMMIDSTALPEQVVQDIIVSAFQSAGQRCSALRVLYLQEDIADNMLFMIKGAIKELTIGDPMKISTDIGPIIDIDAKIALQKYAKKFGAKIQQSSQKDNCFLPPTIIEISGMHELKHEAFGPILHIVRFNSRNMMAMIDQINASQYGLTFGIHSRIQSTIDKVINHIKVGNVYVNRNTIGAVVGVQPFGGENLSGTGPKAGGPHYLTRFAVERTTSTDTTASGGNASLLSLMGD